MLVRMGVPVINIYDYDEVELHNIPNQSFDTRHIGKAKVEALEQILKDINPNVRVNAINTKVDEEEIEKMEGYVFSLVDSMAVRKQLWNAIKSNENIVHYWESRLGSDQGRVYTIDLNAQDTNNFSAYEEDFYEDDTSEMSACGTSITVLGVVFQTAALMITQFIDVVMETQTNAFKTIFDSHYNKFEQNWVTEPQNTSSFAINKGDDVDF